MIGIRGLSVATPFLRTLLALVLCIGGCAAPERPAGGRTAAPRDGLLRPWLTIASARIVEGADALGFPVPRAASQLARLMQPVSAATSGTDVFVLDAGLGGLFRYEVGRDQLVRMGSFRPVPGARVRVLADQTLVVLDPVRRSVLRLDRTGRTLRVYASERELMQPVSMAVDETEQLLFVADATLGRIVAFRLGTGVAVPIVPIASESQRVHGIGAIAAGDRILYVVDPLMRQIAVLARDGRILRVFGHADLVRPHAVAVDSAGRVWVLDEGDQGVKVFENGRLLETAVAQAPRLSGPTDLDIAGGTATFAEAGAARVQLMRLTSGGAR